MTTTTPTDSAMTAERRREVGYLLGYTDLGDVWTKEHWAAVSDLMKSHDALTADRTKLAADLARVEGERGDLRDWARKAVALLSDLEGTIDVLIYDQQVADDFETPDDAPMFLNLSMLQVRCIGRAISEAPVLDDLSAEEQALINRAWERHKAAKP